MSAMILVLHVILAGVLVIMILLQRSDGGALGGLGGGTFGGMMTGRGSANLLTKSTAVIAACFMLSSMVLAVLATDSRAPRSFMEDGAQPTAPAATPGTEAPAPPPEETEPSVPVAR